MNAARWIDLCQGPKAFLYFSGENADGERSRSI